MRTIRTRTLAVTILLASAPGAALASGGAPATGQQEEDAGLAAARKAVAAKDWPEAVRLLTEVLERKGPSADVHNLLGNAERQQGHLAAAFAHYEQALRLDPEHRGAHEYVGEAFLQAGNLEKAEEHLAALDRLCFRPCDEYRDLKRSIEAYRRDHASR